jgi:hypothetical protein
VFLTSMSGLAVLLLGKRPPVPVSKAEWAPEPVRSREFLSLSGIESQSTQSVANHCRD